MTSPIAKRTEKRLKTLAKKTVDSKAMVLAELAQYPVVTNACKRASVGRATYYKWIEEDKMFAHAVNSALMDGKRYVADMAKSHLLKLVANGDKTAIIFLLKNYDSDFTDKVRYQYDHRHTFQLDKTDKAILRKAIENIGLGALVEDEEIDVS